MSDELRDKLVEALGLSGWNAHRWRDGRGHAIGKKQCSVCDVIEGTTSPCRCMHPIPPLDSDLALGWAAKNMPEGWFNFAVRGPEGERPDWAAWATRQNLPELDETVYRYGATEAEARYRLLLAVLTAAKV